MGAKYMYMYTGIKIIVFVDSFCFAFLFYAFLCLSFCTTAPKSLNFIKRTRDTKTKPIEQQVGLGAG